MTSNFSIQQSLIEYDFNMTYEKQNTEKFNNKKYEQIGITLYKSV